MNQLQFHTKDHLCSTFHSVQGHVYHSDKNLKPKETKALIYFQTTSYLLSTQNSTYQCSRFLSSEVDMQRGLEGEKAVREMELLQTTVKVESKGR